MRFHRWQACEKKDCLLYFRFAIYTYLINNLMSNLQWGDSGWSRSYKDQQICNIYMYILSHGSEAVHSTLCFLFAEKYYCYWGTLDTWHLFIIYIYVYTYIFIYLCKQISYVCLNSMIKLNGICVLNRLFIYLFVLIIRFVYLLFF